jgi:PAS domain S-box-containing protein
MSRVASSIPDDSAPATKHAESGLIGSAPVASPLASVFDASGDLVWAADGAGLLSYLNRTASKRWPEAGPSTAAALLIPEAQRSAFARAMEQALSGGVSDPFEWGEFGPGGVRHWFSTAVSPLAGGGVLCVSREITERKRVEERLRLGEQLMVDTQGVAHLGTWVWDITEPTATWSAELYRIYGLSPDAYVPSYEQYLTMVHPDDRARVMEATNRVFQQHVPYSHDERVFRPDGSIRHLHTWAHPVLDETGKLTKLVGVCQDVTDRVVAEERVHEANRNLERRVAERTALVEETLRDLEAVNSMIGHDLRAPLTTIDLTCDLLLRDATPAAAERVGRIRRASGRIGAMLADLLKLAREGQSELRRVEVDLSAICRDVVADLRKTSPERRVKVSIADDLRCLGDPGLLRVVIENLVGNAWKYSARVEHAIIEVGSREVESGQMFFVRDNGAGFMAEAGKLFRAFQRLHASQEFEGVGIGLVSVRRIVERHGGTIEAVGEPGRGATFSFVLPRPERARISA